MKIRVLVFIALFGVVALPGRVLAAQADLSIDQGSISFSTDAFYVGEQVRIYARVRNVGDVDMTASVLFYQGPAVIGGSQPVSLRASGAAEEVFVDFTVPTGLFNIRAVVAGASPTDDNSANNETMTVLYEPLVDTDRDGLADDVDNCIDEPNANQTDTDGDDAGDVCDNDDDNDGVADSVETKQGTDPLTADTDGDNVNDADDFAPKDASITTEPVNAPMPVATAPVSSTAKPTASINNIAETSDATDESVDSEDKPNWPSRAFGIFSSTASVAPDEAGIEASFFSLDNPIVQGLLGLLAVLIVGSLAAIIGLRRKDSDEDEIDV